MIEAQNDPKITMHKLLGKHDYYLDFNSETYDKERICRICGYKESAGSSISLNPDDILKTTTAFRYGMITANEALQKLGLANEHEIKRLHDLLESI